MKHVKFNRHLLSEAVRFGLVACATGLIAGVATPAYAQEEGSDEAVELDRIEVTGSRLKRVDTEGPQPILTISAEDIKASGDVSVADVLRDSSFNSFGSFQGGSGFSGGAQGTSTVSLRGIGSQYTLILVNGRRISNSPALSGDSQNVNSIPFAAVERIEILRDGASAVYGSDAIGGVINVILKENFNGFVIGGQASRPEADGGGNDNLLYGTMGITGDSGQMVFSYENYTRQIILAAERPGLLGPSDLTTPEGVQTAAGLGLLSPTGFPGRYRRLNPATGGLFPTGNPLRRFEPGPGCPTTFGSDPNFPQSAITPASFFGLGAGNICAYNYAAVAGSTAQLNRDNMSVFGEYQVSDNTRVFIRSLNSRTKSFGRFAPTPSTLAVIVPGDASFNPTRGELGPGLGYPLAVNIRFTPLGPRDSYVYDYVNDTQFGFNGLLDIFGGAEWEVAVGHSRTKQDGFGYNYVIQPLLQVAVDQGLNPFSVTEVAAAAATFATTITDDNFYRDQFADARLSWDVAEWDGRPIGLVVGTEFHDLEFSSTTDQQSQAGQVVGSAGASAGGRRNYYSIFAETLLPVLDNFEVGLALRYDKYNDFGNETSPKISLAYRPTEDILLRANWGEGFKAPDLVSLFGSPSQSFIQGRDRIDCLQQGIDPFSQNCANVQRETLLPSNPDLFAETSKQWTVGAVWSPTKEFSASVDYYDIEIEDQISRLTVQSVLDAEFRCQIENRQEFCDASQWGSVDRSRLGADILVVAPLANTAANETSGIDLSLNYRLDTDWGTFNNALNVSYIFKFDRESVRGTGLADRLDFLGFPEMRADARVGWSLGDWSANITGNYTKGWSNCLPPNTPEDTLAELCSTGDSNPTRVGSFTTWDVQVGYAAPWDGRITLGVRNAFDKQAVLDDFGAVDPTHTSGIYGRTPFLSYEQTF